MLYEWRKGSNASVAIKNICKVYGNVLEYRTCLRWFEKFSSGDLSLEDRPERGRPTEVDNECLKTLVESDPRKNTTVVDNEGQYIVD